MPPATRSTLDKCRRPTSAPTLNLHVGNNIALREHGRRRQSRLDDVHHRPRGRARQHRSDGHANRRLRGGSPATVELSVDARDEFGRPVADGTQVIFGVSPPNRETTTYTATISNGHARFSGLTLEAGDATGSWLATALVTLPSGTMLRADASFNLRAGAPKSPGPH